MRKFSNRVIMYCSIAAILLGYELIFVRPVRSFAIILAIAVFGIALIAFFYYRHKES